MHPILLSKLSPQERFEFVIRMADNDPSGDDWDALAVFCPLSQIETAAEACTPITTGPAFVKLTSMLAALHAFDVAVETVTSYRGHAYLLGDEQVTRLCQTFDRINEGSRRGLEALATLGLIYRFNVARKFGYSEREIMQLRLNSWGRYLIDSYKLTNTGTFEEALSTSTSILAANVSRYEELFSLCSTHERPLNTESIHRLNETVPIRVVA